MGGDVAGVATIKLVMVAPPIKNRQQNQFWLQVNPGTWSEIIVFFSKHLKIYKTGQSQHYIEIKKNFELFFDLSFRPQKRPKGFRLNLRKLGQPSVKLNSTEKENFTEVLDVLLKYSKINKESKCPHIEGIKVYR